MSHHELEPPVEVPELEAFRAEMDDDDLVGELIESFLEACDTRVPSLVAAIEAGDGGGASALAHSIKGSAGNFGARPLMSLCALLEQLPTGSPRAESVRLVQSVQAEYDRLRTYLRLYLRDLE